MTNEWPKKENKELVSEKENIAQALEEIAETKIFDPEYLENISLVVFSMEEEDKSMELFKNGHTKTVGGTDYNSQDFMQGRRTDFIGINTKRDFAELDPEALSDRQILLFLFVEGKLSYEEFVAHEIAHNLFDKEYKVKHGEFEDDNGITNVSQEYLDIISSRLEELVARYYPSLDMGRFNIQRQKIAEIFAMIHEREFCRRSNINFNIHIDTKQKVKEFFSNPEEILIEFNKKHSKDCKLEDIYEENHILSLIITPLLEEEYPKFEDRKNFFWKK
ncbi:MAG: hypothetical protein WC678_05045 [Parcubacteria group bacterium]|jgi:hypothetical protein